MPSPSTSVATVTGPIATDRLGAVLMHEHVYMGFSGWEADPRATRSTHAEAMAVATDRIAEMQSGGIAAMVDPCPIDLGRDVTFVAELSRATNFPIIVATGLFLEGMAGAHWKFTCMSEGPDYLAETFVRELTEGVGDTGIRAGVIKVATGTKRITRYERIVLEAAAMASNATGAPITTHTDRGQLGDEQQAFLVGHGVPAHRIIIGHSCGSSDHDYHCRIARGGSYLGFDRFGIESERPDELRIDALVNVLAAGFADRVVVSQDTTMCWNGRPRAWAPEPTWHVLRFVRDIAPQLRERGVTDEQLQALLVTNPRRYFEGVPLAAVAH